MLCSCLCYLCFPLYEKVWSNLYSNRETCHVARMIKYINYPSMCFHSWLLSILDFIPSRSFTLRVIIFLSSMHIKEGMHMWMGTLTHHLSNIRLLMQVLVVDLHIHKSQAIIIVNIFPVKFSPKFSNWCVKITVNLPIF